ncbi:MAG: hypothetical protein ACK5JT_19235 [Hyphomicrobiaceae bacterium]
MIAGIMAILPSGMRPLTSDQVRLLKTDNVVSEAAVTEGRTLTAFGIDGPHAISSVVPSYLEQFRPKGQYSHYRS